MISTMFERTAPVDATTADPNFITATLPLSTAETKPNSTLPIGAVLSHYVIVGHLGEGGMGVVYAAYDPRLDRKIALKFLRDVGVGAAYEEARGRILREAQAMARLSHPNVIAVYDVGVFEGQIYVAMEFVEGVTLRAWQQERTRPIADIVTMYTQAGRGLAAAHAQGIVHRDFKPDNVLVGKDGRARVLDFGLAQGHVAEDNSTTHVPVQPISVNNHLSTSSNAFDMKLTRADAIMGSPSYMSPEQFSGESTDARTDQYSFCVALYEALWGALPFDGETFDELMRNVIQGNFAPPKKGAKIPERLRRAVFRGLSTKREDRFGTMTDLLDAIQLPPPRSLWKWLGLGLVVVVPAIALGVVTRREDPGTTCYTSRDKLSGVWDGPRKKAIREAFLSTEKPYAKDAYAGVEQALDTYVNAWVDMRTEACLATRVRGEQSAELLDLRLECLSRKLAEVRNFTDELTTATAGVVEKSVQSANSLPDLDICANADLLRAPVRPPGDPAVQAKIDDVRQQLARAQALHWAGRYKEQLPILEGAAAMASDLHYRPLEAEALQGLARGRRYAGARAEASTTLVKAILAAEASRRDDVSANAWLVLARWQADAASIEQARASADHAAAAIERIGNDKKSMAKLEAVWGDIEYAAGQYQLATNHYQKALSLTEHAFGPEHVETAAVLYGLATTTRFQGKFNDALGYARRALTLREKALGPDHPAVATTISLIGWVLMGRGDIEEARRMHERALAIAEKVYGPDDPILASMLTALGDTLAKSDPEKAIAVYTRSLTIDEKRFGVGHFKTAPALENIGITLVFAQRPLEALPYFDRALAIMEKAKGPTYAELSTSLVQRAHAFTLLRRYDEALADCVRAVDIAKKVHGEKHPYLADALVEMGRVYLARRQFSMALPVLERALDMRKALEENARAIAEIQFELARATWEANVVQRPRAIELAKDAERAYESAGAEAKRELTEVQAWLHSHVLPGSSIPPRP